LLQRWFSDLVGLRISTLPRMIQLVGNVALMLTC